MSCDIMDIANSHLSGGAEFLAAGVRRLAGCLDARPEAMPCDDKRPAGEDIYFIYLLLLIHDVIANK